MKTKSVISLSTGLEDAEKVTVAFLVAVGSAESHRPTLMFLTKEAVCLVIGDVAHGTACEGCPPLEDLMRRYAGAGGRFLVCPICFDARHLEEANLVSNAEVGGTAPMWGGSAMSQPTRSVTDRSLGSELAHAITTQDPGVLRRLLSTPLTFRAVTPRRFWDAETAVGVVDVILGVWFGPDKRVTGITSLATDSVGEVQKVSYRLRVDLESGPSVVQQVIYYTEAG